MRFQEYERYASLPELFRNPLLVIAQKDDIRPDMFEHSPRAYNRVTRQDAEAGFELRQRPHALRVFLSRQMSFQFFDNLVHCHHHEKLVATRGGLDEKMFMSLMQSIKNAKYHTCFLHTIHPTP